MVHPRLKHLVELGEMGRIIAGYDWKSTQLGDPSRWPHGLLITLGTMLRCEISSCLLWGPELVLLYNDAYAAYLGVKHPGTLGRTPGEIWPEIYDELKKMYDDLFRGKATNCKDWCYNERFYSFTLSPVIDENGTITGGLAYVFDTSEEKIAKASLRKSERNFRRYQDFSPIPFFSITEDWKLDYMNPAGLRQSLTPTKIEDLYGQSFFEIWPGTRDSEFHKQYEKVQKGEIVSFEAIYDPYGHWYKVFAFPLYPGVGVFAHDITDIKLGQAELNEAVASRDRFLSIASHELNTPLTSLKLSTQMMKRKLPDGITPERLDKFFDQSEGQIKRLSQIVDDMLDASRIREGRFSLNFEACDLSKIVQEMTESMAPLFTEAGHEVPGLVIDGKNFVCQADPSRYGQVVTNLLMNACKYGGPSPVEIKLKQNEKEILLCVSDHGPGILPENRERIFEQYFRGSKAVGEGLGLGLYISRQIIQAHHGKIWVESVPGEGSTFFVSMPGSQ